ncbi:hypothetical protein D9M73_244170 [compost metagenome]
MVTDDSLTASEMRFMPSTTPRITWPPLPAKRSDCAEMPWALRACSAIWSILVIICSIAAAILVALSDCSPVPCTMFCEVSFKPRAVWRSCSLSAPMVSIIWRR